tara:strand:+ start:16487 stop:16864 length:378 start_codon:yes stop_codon:yes gene_type:complete
MSYKTCNKCDEQCGVRTKICSNCGQRFATQILKKVKQGTSVDWTLLVRGDKIKVIKGTGPYYQSKGGKKSPMGCPHGVFTVFGLNTEGIIVCDKHGFGYVYMGEEKYCEDTGIQRVSHKIRKIDE